MNIEKKVIEVVIEHLGLSDDQVSLDHSLTKDYGVDSMDAVDLLLGLSEAFNLKMPFSVMDDVETVGDLVRLIEQQLAAKSH